MLRVVLTTFLVATITMAADHIDKPESVGMSSERLERLDRNLQGYVDRQEVPGVVALIARRGKIVYLKGFGPNRLALLRS